MSDIHNLIARLQGVQDNEEFHCDHMLTAGVNQLLAAEGMARTDFSTAERPEYSNAGRTDYIHCINGIWHFGRLPH